MLAALMRVLFYGKYVDSHKDYKGHKEIFFVAFVVFVG
jgi:hypothetical protein